MLIMLTLAKGEPVLSLIMVPEIFVGVSVVWATVFIEITKNKKTTKYFIN